MKKAAKKTAKKAAKRSMAHIKVSAAFREYVLSQLDELGEVTARAMFGGVGLYRRGVFFGIVAGDVLFFKVGEANRRDFEKHKAKPFMPYAGRSSTKYFAVPVAILESPADLAAWARKAIRAAEAS
jgi:DNA transformation protein and related proteins